MNIEKNEHCNTKQRSIKIIIKYFIIKKVIIPVGNVSFGKLIQIIIMISIGSACGFAIT